MLAERAAQQAAAADGPTTAPPLSGLSVGQRQEVTSMDLATLDGTVLALVLISETDTGEDDWAVSSGVFHLRDGKAFLDRGPSNPELELLPEWLRRIKPTNDKTRSILLNAAHYLPLRVGDIPEDADPAAFEATGLEWPER